MAEIIFSEEVAKSLKDKVVVLTGGAQGIGAASIALFHKFGAHVYFGDWDETKGQQTASLFANKNNSGDGGGKVHFQKLDVREYASQLSLFETAYKAQGRIDIAIACAGVIEPPGCFDPAKLTLEDIREEALPLRSILEINLISVVNFTRIALAYFLASPPLETGPGAKDAGFTRSIQLVSSVAGIIEAPGLFAYSTSKHGVVGLMRSLRPVISKRFGGTRVNAICPWATDTQLIAGVKDGWLAQKLPLNSSEDVAKIVVHCSADSGLTGKAIYVTGGRFFDTEEGLDRTLGEWMGRENEDDFRRGQVLLGSGDGWTKPGK